MVCPELPTASVGSSQATTDAVDNSAPFAIRTDPLIVRGKLFRQTEPLLQPALVPADEPTGNLDTQSADRIFDLMRSVSQVSGTTFLIVTHDPRLAKRCDRIIEMVDGKIASDLPNQATVSGKTPP